MVARARPRANRPVPRFPVAEEGIGDAEYRVRLRL